MKLKHDPFVVKGSFATDLNSKALADALMTCLKYHLINTSETERTRRESGVWENK